MRKCLLKISSHEKPTTHTGGRWMNASTCSGDAVTRRRLHVIGQPPTNHWRVYAYACWHAFYSQPMHELGFRLNIVPARTVYQWKIYLSKHTNSQEPHLSEELYLKFLVNYFASRRLSIMLVSPASKIDVERCGVQHNITKSPAEHKINNEGLVCSSRDWESFFIFIMKHI